MRLIQLFGHEPRTDELAESGGEDRAGDSEIGTEVVEATDTAKRRTQHENRPPIPDQSKSSLDRAVLARPITAASGCGRRFDQG